MKNRPDGLEETRYEIGTELTYCRVKNNAPSLLHTAETWNSYFHSIKAIHFDFKRKILICIGSGNISSEEQIYWITLQLQYITVIQHLK